MKKKFPTNYSALPRLVWWFRDSLRLSSLSLWLLPAPSWSSWRAMQCRIADRLNRLRCSVAGVCYHQRFSVNKKEKNKNFQTLNPCQYMYERGNTKEKTHLSRHKVPKSNRGKCYEAEIRSIEEIPLFRFTEKVSSAEYIANDEKNAEPDWNGPNRRIWHIDFIVVAIHRVLIHHWCNMTCLSVDCEAHGRHNSRRWCESFFRCVT